MTFNLAGDWLADEKGVRGIPNGSLIMLVASTEDREFAPPSADGLVDPRSDDRILEIFTASDDNGKANQGSYAASIQVNFGDEAMGLENFGPGDPLLIRWFPTLPSTDLESLPSGPVPYGKFRADEILFGSNAAWQTPGANSAIINLSVVAGAFGNRYNPQGPISVEILSARELAHLAMWEVAQAHLRVSVLASGSLTLAWPMLEGTDPLGRLQQSTDLIQWTDAEVTLDLSQPDQVSAIVEPSEQTVFYRVATSPGTTAP